MPEDEVEASLLPSLPPSLPPSLAILPNAARRSLCSGNWSECKKGGKKGREAKRGEEKGHWPLVVVVVVTGDGGGGAGEEEGREERGAFVVNVRDYSNFPGKKTFLNNPPPSFP